MIEIKEKLFYKFADILHFYFAARESAVLMLPATVIRPERSEDGVAGLQDDQRNDFEFLLAAGTRSVLVIAPAGSATVIVSALVASTVILVRGPRRELWAYLIGSWEAAPPPDGQPLASIYSVSSRSFSPAHKQFVDVCANFTECWP